MSNTLSRSGCSRFRRLVRLVRSAAAWAALVTLGYAAPAWARIPPMVNDAREGVWIGAGEVFVWQTKDRWSVFPAGANVNKIAADGKIVWVATDDGVIRFDTGSRRSTRITMDDGLPSQVVAAVAVDELYVWFATNKGLARYRKLDRTIRVYTEEDGLPSKAVNDALTVGRQVWFATREGIAYFSPDVDGLRSFGEKDGLATGDVAELFQVSEDVWCRTEAGVSRFRIQQRVFTNFSLEQMKAQQIRVFTVDGGVIWLGTDNGLFRLNTADDSLLQFPQQDALESRTITGIEKTPDYVYITTEREVVQWSRLTTFIRRFTPVEGLTRKEGNIGTVLNGELWTVVFPDGAMVYNVGNDQFTERMLAQTESNESKTTAHLFGRLNLKTPYDLKTHQYDPQRYQDADANLSFGHSFSPERNLSGSVRLDYGNLKDSGIRDLQYKVEYMGGQKDLLRNVRVEDKLKYETVEEGLERPLLLQGAYVQVASPGAEPKVSVTANAGFRRGVIQRDFITGPRQPVYTLSKKNIVPGSERVYVDGEQLTSGTDYTLVSSAGQLVFLNQERIDDLSVVWVEYEADLMPKKELGALSLLTMLPSDNEVGTWARAGEAQMITDEAGLYNRIDGGAPKYIERGWVSSVYVEFRQGARSIQVAIHDMGTDVGAETIYKTYLPAARQTINDPKGKPRENAVVDLNLSGTYAAYAFLNNFYIELNIDEKSDTSLTSIQIFANQILDRKNQAGGNAGDQFKQWLVASRVAVNPANGLTLGARVVELQDTDDRINPVLFPGSKQAVADPRLGRPFSDETVPMQRARPPLQLTTGVADARYQKAVGQGGLFTGYGEFAGSKQHNGGGTDGWAGMGFLRLSHPMLEGSFSGRKESQGFTPLGSDSTRFGKLQDEMRLSATGYPVDWLPTTVFFTRQRSWIDDGTGTITDDTGSIQHALARIQLNKKGLPMTSLQVGSTILDNQNFRTSRLQAVGQTDYDLAEILSFTRIKRLSLRALYSISEAETEKRDIFAYADRVQLTRLEGKFSPTATESAYALFRSRNVNRQSMEGGEFERTLMHWELLSGAQSTIIPGLVPKVSYNITFDDNRVATTSASPSSATGGMGTTGTGPVMDTTGLTSSTTSIIPPGPGVMTIVPPTRTARTSVGAGLGIYPGQWWKVLAPAALEPQISIGNSETTENQTKTIFSRVYRYENRAVWIGQGKWDVELYQLRQTTVAQDDRHETDRITQLRNRLVYRPVPESPITLRLNYLDTKGLNDPEKGAPANSRFDRANYEGVLEWMMRWNRVLTTRSRANFVTTVNSNVLYKDATTGAVSFFDGTQYQAGPDIEFRFFPLQEVAALYIFQRDGLYRLFGNGEGAMDALSFFVEAGTIWRLGDKIYLDGAIRYDGTSCLSQPKTGEATCTDAGRLTPRVYLTVNL